MANYTDEELKLIGKVVKDCVAMIHEELKSSPVSSLDVTVTIVCNTFVLCNGMTPVNNVALMYKLRSSVGDALYSTLDKHLRSLN